mmetsp:Transcript_10546/g.23230  ORF Transcript_10546/g.23230 Transcript_10546/m.23230 type:complete len:891 (-) Transcript_10546:172-2844(-)|eukprot:CAMPEP_0206502168 /NCGR_PEP_ID=MMETSP0324_2-20121206/53829_1 /ASSEMBLY_ACC=CAM_ASM_000836 /TAXON_ID=2866 /ORGANISM="Crypthecodinium cohnii, Strain Seligo" /LENGTH=890 /DNA_ID=CAMNT_0053990295 /DNA_START=166 /DNA_END=2838 /DNA_ORIENTATION=+
MAPAGESIEAVANAITWIGYWTSADFDVASLRGDALGWSGEDVRRFVGSKGRDAPSEEIVDTQDSPCPFTGAGASWNIAQVPEPWWVSAQSHDEGPLDDESIPRKLEGWWRVEEYERDRLSEVGEDLVVGELCFVEKLWNDRVRVYKVDEQDTLGICRLNRACDLQLMKKKGQYAGAHWDLLRDNGEGGDDPDDIRVGQRRPLLGGEYGQLKLKGIEAQVLSYVEWMDRWTVEIPVKDGKGKNLCIAVVPDQLREPKMPRDPRANGHVTLDLSLRAKSLELAFRDAELRAQGPGIEKATGGVGDGRFRLRMRFVSRVKPGGRVWAGADDSPYSYAEVRYIASGDYGMVYRVLRMVDPAKKAVDNSGDAEEEDPHLVLDVPRGCDKSAIAKAYRKMARKMHPDKVPENEREKAVEAFQRVHQAYEALLADPERSSDLLVLKVQHPFPPGKGKKVSIPMSFHTEVKCLTLVSQLRLPNVQKIVEVGPREEFIVSWPYIPEALLPCNETDGVNQVDRVDLVRQGWSDFSRSRRSAQQIIRTMMALIRHDVMVVDPVQNIIVERESGEPLFIDFGRGETAGSIYTTRIKTFMKKVLSLLVRCIAKVSYDVVAKFIRDIENTLFEELEQWQDEKTRDQKQALALVASSTKWQEGIQCCRDIWASDEENPFRKMFVDTKDVLPGHRDLREARELALEQDSDEENNAERDDYDDDPEGLCDADITTLTPVQRLLRAKRKKSRRAKLPKERPNITVKLMESLPDGTLGLGLDDADEDQRGVVIVQIHKQMQSAGWEVGDRIIEINGQEVDEWDDFKRAWDIAKQFGTNGVVFGLVRFGLDTPPEPSVPKCLHCGSKGKHLQKCTNWKHMPDGVDCVFFCGRDCQKEAWKACKQSADKG